MSISEICNRGVATVARGASIVDAARMMRDQHVGCVVVVEEGDKGPLPVGMLTDRDIVVAVLALNLDPEEISVGDVMSPELHTVNAWEGISDTLEAMRAKGVRRLPVIDADGVLTGVVSSDDMIGMLADELSSLAFLVSREQRHERDVRRVKV